MGISAAALATAPADISQVFYHHFLVEWRAGGYHTRMCLATSPQSKSLVEQ
jgi:hypothetical protein